MKLILDFLPLVAFFVTFKFAGIYTATAVAVVTSLLLVAVQVLRRAPVTVMQWISLAIVLIFGGATILLHDERFILVKPTALYWIFTMILLVGKIILKKDFIKTVFTEADLSLPPPSWSRLTWLWIAFLASMGALNLVVAFNFPREIWVNFKVWISMGITFAFIFLQMLWITKQQPASKS